ncbi:uncharacterized protein N7459_007836 [Penicillium hispanicum]|uniref:uncharacterized protein n=1 Tax=Penicillium hispanicum TaxID=1080232 RepID=UPI00253FEB79|nr:uncharacterized protein N7459_007836 [Penicillium hispanicum]KAJ5573409.1 hypothetical protein N7459_007836 [Penicillium hispanicum]
MSFEAYSTCALDYWIVAGDSPAEIVEAYAKVTGCVPMMPESGTANPRCSRVSASNVPLDVIAIDAFHWKHKGSWKFDLVR